MRNLNTLFYFNLTAFTEVQHVFYFIIYLNLPDSIKHFNQ